MKRIRPTSSGLSLRELSKMALPVLQNVAGTLWPKVAPSAPAFITWGVTERCHLTCEHCDMGRPRAGELDHEGRLEIARRLARSTTWGISLIGGEPFLVPGLLDYAEILKDAGKWVALGTNGDLIGPHLRPICDLGVDSMTISFDGHTPERHDAFRGKPGLFAKTLGFVDELLELRREGKPRLQVRCTINRHNFRELDGFIDFWQDRADNLILQIVQNNALHHVRDERCLFQPEDRPEFEAALARLQKSYPFLRGQYYDLLPRYVFEPEQLYRDLGFRCLLVPASSMMLLPDGTAKLCYAKNDSVVGNVLEHEVAEIWSRAQTRSTQKRMQSSDYDCMCWEAAYSKNLDLLSVFGPLEQASQWLGLSAPPTASSG